MATPHPLIATLAAERYRRGISGRALAARLGYSHQSVVHWETGATPTLTAAEDYAAALGYDLTLTPKKA